MYALTRVVGSFRRHGCYAFGRVGQRGWDLLDLLDVTILYAVTRGGGILEMSWLLRLRTQGRDLLDVMDVLRLGTH